MPFRPPRGLKKAMREGQTKVGMFVGTSSVQVAELSAALGVDYLLADLEHGERNDTASAAELIRAGDVYGVPVLVRVPEIAPGVIAHVLDHGAVGVCAPHVRNREDAERLVSYAKYAPDGTRAMANFVRAADFSFDNWNDYWSTANEEIMVVAIIEDREGLANLDEICSVPGIDVIWIGTGDLSQDVGLTGEPSHPTMIEAVERGQEAAALNGKISLGALGAVGSPEEARAEVDKAVNRGAHMLVCLDSSIFSATLGGLVGAAREAIGRS